MQKKRHSRGGNAKCQTKENQKKETVDSRVRPLSSQRGRNRFTRSFPNVAPGLDWMVFGVQRCYACIVDVGDVWTGGADDGDEEESSTRILDPVYSR